jgi:hypothetical protein
MEMEVQIINYRIRQQHNVCFCTRYLCLTLSARQLAGHAVHGEEEPEEGMFGWSVGREAPPHGDRYERQSA